MKNKGRIWLPVMIVLTVIIVVFAALSIMILLKTKASSRSSTAETDTQVIADSRGIGENYISKTLDGFVISPDVDVQLETEKASDALENPDAYILSDSDTRELTEEDLAGLEAKELTYARNEIYARHGKVFQSSELNEYFGGKSWYTADESFEDASISDTERANAELIVNYQKDNNLEYSPQ